MWVLYGYIKQRIWLFPGMMMNHCSGSAESVQLKKIKSGGLGGLLTLRNTDVIMVL